MEPKRVLLIINHKSGNQKRENIEHLFAAHMQKRQMDHKVLELSDHPKTAINNEINYYKPNIVIAAGGDGTINMISDVIQYKDVLLLIFPFGSANGMARDLSMPTDFNQALNLLENGKVVKLDLLKINNNTSVHLADVGLNARIVKRFQLDKKEEC